MNISSIISFLSDSKLVTDSGAINCENETLLGVLSIAKVVVRILQILVPIALIIWGSIDLGKAVIAGKDEDIKKARKPFVQRIIADIIVFLIPWIVHFIMGLINGDAYYACWEAANNGPSIFKTNDPVDGGVKKNP